MYQKIAHFVRNMFGGSLPAQVSGIETARKVMMINLLCFGGSLLLFMVGISSFLQGQYWVCLIDFVVMTFLVSVAVYLRLTLNTKIAGYFITVFVGLTFLFLVLFRGGASSFYVWSFPFPMIVLFLLGIRKGTIASLLLLSGACVAFFLGSIGLLPSPYSVDQISRYLPTYIFITLMAIGMEKVGNDTNRRLKELNIELENSYQFMKQQAVTDALTGIPNRHSFIEYIDAEFMLRQSEDIPISILMCDIDSFKLYNDTYGHSAGDDALVKIACAISSALPNAGDFCARYGGEEFIVVLPETLSPDACAVAETIRQCVAELALPNEDAPAAPYVTISIGVATKGADAYMSYDDLIRLADMALYRAKGNGRNRVEAVNMD